MTAGVREGPGRRGEEPPGVPGTDACWVPAGPLGGDHVSGCIPQDQPDVVEFAQVLEPFQEVSHRCFPVHKPLEQRLLEEQHWLGSESERLRFKRTFVMSPQHLHKTTHGPHYGAVCFTSAYVWFIRECFAYLSILTNMFRDCLIVRYWVSANHRSSSVAV